jgi:hypothetical protein
MHVMTHSGFFPELQDFHSVHDNAPFSAADTGTILYAGWLDLGVLETIKFFFSVRTLITRNSICFGYFSVCFAKPNHIFFGLFRCFGPVSKQPKQTEKISKKQISIRVSSKHLIFFSVRTETNRNSTCFGCFSFFFFVKPNKIFFGLFQCFGPVSRQPKQTELMVWGIKKVYILTNLLLFRLVFCLFRLFRNAKTPCFETPKLPVSILKRNNRNKRLVSDSAETSFGCFNTKQVSEDTLVGPIRYQ